ncbi:MAG: exodeoxyribonuclease III [Spirochaetales bacterium]|nr:exodeoxyribonuclease III [Spirochaetales bacterium]
MKTLVSWNVNGIRAAEKKGLFDWMSEKNADFICLQETKAQKEQLSESFIEPTGYKSWFAEAEKKGYSGVVTYSKEEPISVETLGIDEFDAEGRSIILEYPDFKLINCYFPNSQEAGKRLDYKLRFCEAVFDFCNNTVKNGKNIILCGDYNIAHKPIDLANPKRNEKNPGYLPEERAWMDKFTQNGYIDTFRLFCKDPDRYSWWSYRFKAREKNIGWRIDYFCVNSSFKEKLESADILDSVMGSDHCPVEIKVNL